MCAISNASNSKTRIQLGLLGSFGHAAEELEQWYLHRSRSFTSHRIAPLPLLLLRLLLPGRRHLGLCKDRRPRQIDRIVHPRVIVTIELVPVPHVLVLHPQPGVPELVGRHEIGKDQQSLPALGHGAGQDRRPLRAHLGTVRVGPIGVVLYEIDGRLQGVGRLVPGLAGLDQLVGGCDGGRRVVDLVQELVVLVDEAERQLELGAELLGAAQLADEAFLLDGRFLDAADEVEGFLERVGIRGVGH
mmetsp:Transcript_19614/g.45633  ORF Transcript_19614/g.45633 Transcript_19614/m.45633 type:complete len:245 (-) Transcript_19614:1949-2683(-)